MKKYVTREKRVFSPAGFICSLFSPLENNIHIFAPRCNTLYVYLLGTCSLYSNTVPVTAVLYFFSHRFRPELSSRAHDTLLTVLITRTASTTSPFNLFSFERTSKVIAFSWHFFLTDVKWIVHAKTSEKFINETFGFHVVFLTKIGEINKALRETF